MDGASFRLLLLHPLRQYLVLGELLLQVGEFRGWPPWCSPVLHWAISRRKAFNEAILPNLGEAEAGGGDQRLLDDDELAVFFW